MKLKHALLGLLLGLAVCLQVMAQTVYDSEFLNVNKGNPGFATFAFAEPHPPSLTGSTQLIIQCNFHRAEVIMDAGVYGSQVQSDFFPISCTETESIVNNQRAYSFTLNSTPLNEVLTMRDGSGNSFSLNFTINSASWEVVNPGAYQKQSGSAEVVY